MSGQQIVLAFWPVPFCTNAPARASRRFCCNRAVEWTLLTLIQPEAGQARQHGDLKRR
jgi:hypothetical protein